MSTKCAFPLDREMIDGIVSRQKFDVRSASIREMNGLVNLIEEALDVRFVRMEFGIPGLPVHPIAIEAEIEALRDRGVGNQYAPFEGLPALKQEISRFVDRFMNLDVQPACCVPTVGAMEGCFAGIALASRMRPGRDTVLFLEPGFPVNKLQTRFLGVKNASIDLHDHRGDALLTAIRERVAQGDVCAILWSSPNNPSWVVLKESELEGIGKICDEYGVLAIEDLAYFGMDVRQDYYEPGRPPYQPTVMRYTRNGLCLISSSKMFSYAGQRISMMIISPDLWDLESPDLAPFYGTANVGHALVHGVLYPIAACVPESPQYGLLALLRAANDGNRELFEPAREYARRAGILKKMFLDAGFRLVYDNDLGEPLADGFYFTLSHPAYDDGADLIEALLHYGISAITLATTGSARTEGIRACVSLISDAQLPDLEERLESFRDHHPA